MSGDGSHSRDHDLSGSRVRVGLGRALQLRQNPPQRRDQLIPRNMALLELDPEFERFVVRLKLEDKRLRPAGHRLLFLAFPSRLVPRQAALKDPVHHLQHFVVAMTWN
jgi:hypothetical protein